MDVRVWIPRAGIPERFAVPCQRESKGYAVLVRENDEKKEVDLRER